MGAGSHEMDIELGQHGKQGGLKSFLCWNPWKDASCIHGHTYGRGTETGKRKSMRRGRQKLRMIKEDRNKASPHFQPGSPTQESPLRHHGVTRRNQPPKPQAGKHNTGKGQQIIQRGKQW